MGGHFKVITVSRNWAVTAASNEDNFNKTAKVNRQNPLTRNLVQVDLFTGSPITKHIGEPELSI
jgi:hypothetical protein